MCVYVCVCVCVVAVGGSAYLKIIGVLKSTYLYRLDLEKTRCDDIRRFEQISTKQLSSQVYEILKLINGILINLRSWE